MSRLGGKRIVVTGAARGIGAELAVELRARGATPITADMAPGTHVTCDVSIQTRWRPCSLKPGRSTGW